QAVEYNGRTMLGGYVAKETLKDEAQGTTTKNDSQAALGRIFLDVTEIGPLQNQFVFDFRDKYDFFGVHDRENLLLSEANEPQLRQFALKSDPKSTSLQWSAGRFPVSPAGVPVTDGAMLGFSAHA